MASLAIPLLDLLATETLAGRIAVLLRPGALLRALLADPALEVPSPSYTLVQSYDAPVGPVHHFDLWRLDGPAAVAELGWYDARNGVALVEWSDRLGTLRPDDALTVTLSLADGDTRRAVLTGWPDRLERLP